MWSACTSSHGTGPGAPSHFLTTNFEAPRFGWLLYSTGSYFQEFVFVFVRSRVTNMKTWKHSREICQSWIDVSFSKAIQIEFQWECLTIERGHWNKCHLPTLFQISENIVGANIVFSCANFPKLHTTDKNCPWYANKGFRVPFMYSIGKIVYWTWHVGYHIFVRGIALITECYKSKYLE